LSETDFATLGLHNDLLINLQTLQYEVMTAIQAQSLPLILAGKDVIGQGKTGSGKTAAFGLGLLQKLDTKLFRVQAMVLCPTRELANQVATELRRLARRLENVKILTITGGSAFGPQVGSLEHGAHVVVGTPGRIEDHLRRGTLKLKTVTTLVLDEADRMLDMGFQESIDAIISQVPEKRQTLLFSATFPAQIQAIAKRIMVEPANVKVESTHDNTTIEQHFYQVDGASHRKTALRLLLQHFQPESTLIFCNTKVGTQAVTDMLRSHGFGAIALHGDLEQKDRDQTLVRFANKSATVLVATDVAARGLDIDNVDAIINYDIGHNPEVHVHRIGRTGRAGAKGIACSLYDSNEIHKVALLQANIDPIDDTEPLPAAILLDKPAIQPSMATLQVDSGKKQKIRAGDILGALTGEGGIAGNQVGKINLWDNWTFVAVSRDVAHAALTKLNQGKLKGRSCRARLIGD
jgi:ATP-independent RNA helicase DbpA